jgi:hypothetical protein
MNILMEVVTLEVNNPTMLVGCRFPDDKAVIRELAGSCGALQGCSASSPH